MRIYNSTIFEMIADLWNAEACATDAREQSWCAESVQAEVRASGMTPDEALQGAVHAVCTVLAATVTRSHRLQAWLEADDGDEGDEGDEDYDDEDDGDEEYDDDDVVDGEGEEE